MVAFVLTVQHIGHDPHRDGGLLKETRAWMQSCRASAILCRLQVLLFTSL